MTKKYRELPKLSFSETRDLLLDKIEPLNSENVMGFRQNLFCNKCGSQFCEIPAGRVCHAQL